MKLNIQNKTTEIHTHVETNKDSRISSCMSIPNMKYKHTEIRLGYDEIKEVVAYYWKLQNTIPQHDNMNVMKKIFKLGYSSEDFHIDYGFFTTLKKAEKAKSDIVKTLDTALQEYFIGEICIQELLLNELLDK